MAAYPTVTRVLQGGNVNQVITNGFIISGTQASLQNYVGLNNLRLNETIVTVPKEYEVTSVSDKLIIKYPVVGGSIVPNVNFNQNNNFLPTPNIGSNNVAVLCNVPTAFTSGSSNLNQMTGNIHDNRVTKTKEGTRNVHQEGNSSNVYIIPQKGPCGNNPMVGTAVIHDQTQAKLKSDEVEKIGNLKIHMSESFLPGTIISSKGILDLNFMRNLFEVTNVDISFVNNIPFKPGICDALKKIIHNNLLQDWLMLKCEEKQIEFFKVNDKIQIYSVNSYSAVMSAIGQESSLPLPFITKDAENNTKYYYINFRKRTNDKVKKLNCLIFYDVDNGRKKIPCKYPGIRLDCNFESSVAGFTIHVHKSTTPVYKNSVSYIRQLIIYSHIVWGFLQSWILNVKEHHNNCFSVTDISKNLILNQTSEMNALTDNDDEMMYFIGYSNFYLKFDLAMLKETYTTFSIENFETSFTCDVPIVEYYRQFILINDLHYSDALKNVILFSKKNQMIGYNTRENNCLPRRTNASFKADCFQPTLSSHERPNSQPALSSHERQNFQPTLSSHERQSFQEKVVSHSFTSTQGVPSNEEGRSGGVVQHRQSGSQIFRPVMESNCTNNPNIGNSGNESERPQTTPDVGRPGLTKPLIKTRTVSEINSLLEAPDRDGFHQVSFHTEQRTCRKVQQKKELSPSGFVSLIEQILKTCYATNTLTGAHEDESKDPVVIQKRFDETVNKAIGCVTLEIFIERIYVELLFSFTNKTTQNILNRLIGRAIGMKYPLLKGKFLNTFENIRNELRRTDKTQVGKPLASTPSEPQEKVKQVFMVVSKEIAPTKPNFITTNCLVNPNATLVQLTNSLPSNLATVAPIVSGQSLRQQNSYRAETGQRKIVGEPSLVHKNLPNRVNASKVLSSLEPYESKNKSGTGQNKLNQSPLSTRVKNSNHTAIVADNELNKKKCNFGFNSNTDGKDTAVSNVPYQASVSSAIFRRSEEPKVATVIPSVVKNVSNGNMQNTSLSISVNSQCRDKTNESISAPVPRLVPYSESKTSIDAETSTENESFTTESCQDSLDSVDICSQSDDAEKNFPPTTKEKHFDQYKLKPCSVVLNADDVSNYFKLRRMENEMNSSSDLSNASSFNFCSKNWRKRDSLSEDPDFYDPLSQREVKRKKGVSELEYMEARTRVLQRLRKRSAMYIGRTKDKKMTSDELNNFLVRRNSLVGRSSFVEESTDDEDTASEDSGTEEGENSGTEEDENSKTEEGEKSGFTQTKELKKELRIVLVRLEDTPEYEKYKDSLGLENKNSKMIRMGEKTESYYEHILHMNKQYFELRDGKLYLKEQYCVQDGVIVPTDARGESSEVISFKKEPQSPENEENYSIEFIKEENSLD